MIDLEEFMLKLFVIYFCLLIFFAGCVPVEKRENVSKNERSVWLDLRVENFEKVEKIELPNSYSLNVPFVMQAPLANWDVHDDSCEEAGILLAHYYYLQLPLSKEEADRELKNMIADQVAENGQQVDIFAEEIAKFANEYFGYDEARVMNGEKENMKYEIVKGNPVIVLTTASYLKSEKNDYPEMDYHIVLAVGFDEYGFIVHDVGTYSGENTHYSYGVLDQAMSDYQKEVVVLK